MGMQMNEKEYDVLCSKYLEIVIRDLESMRYHRPVDLSLDKPLRVISMRPAGLAHGEQGMILYSVGNDLTVFSDVITDSNAVADLAMIHAKVKFPRMVKFVKYGSVMRCIDVN